MKIQKILKILGPILNKIDIPARPDHPAQRSSIFNFSTGKCFEVKNTSSDTAEITFYDEISPWGITAKDFKSQLNKITAKHIVLKINSPGGDVFDGIAIYNDLKDHPADITVKVTGLAASAASVVAMAGDKIEMAETAMMMIHNAMVLAFGNKQDLREVADILDKIDGSIRKSYLERTGNSEKDIEAWMDEEKWMDADEALDLGFADTIDLGEYNQPTAIFDVSVYNHTPTSLKKQIENNLREAGYSNSESKAAVNKGFHVLGRREGGEHKPLNLREADGAGALLKSIQDTTRKIQSASK